MASKYHSKAPVVDDRRSASRQNYALGQQLIVKDLESGRVVLCKDIYDAARITNVKPVVIYSALKEPVEERVFNDKYFVKKPPEDWPFL